MAPDVAHAVETGWAPEEIPDADHLLMRVHRVNLNEDGSLKPGAFKDHGGGMSTDWDKYSTAAATRLRAREPNANAVVSMNVGRVRAIPGQIVQHAPLPDNRAHTDVIGKKDAEARVLFSRCCSMVIHIAS